MDSSTSIIELKKKQNSTDTLVNDILKELESETSDSQIPTASNIDSELFSKDISSTKLDKTTEITTGIKWKEWVEYIYDISKLSIMIIVGYFIIHNYYINEAIKKLNISWLEVENSFGNKLVKSLILSILVKIGYTYL